VEDEDQVTILARRGYRVLEAASGAEALDTVRAYTGPIDLLLTDMVMPQMSGAELHREVAALRQSIKVLYMSGYTESGILDRSALAPGTPFLQKPFTAAALRQKVRQALSQQGELTQLPRFSGRNVGNKVLARFLVTICRLLSPRNRFGTASRTRPT